MHLVEYMSPGQSEGGRLVRTTRLRRERTSALAKRLGVRQRRLEEHAGKAERQAGAHAC